MSYFKKIFSGSLILLSLLILFTGCSNEVATSKNTLNIGVLPNLDAVPLLIALDQGYFDEVGVPINIEKFKSAVDRDTALQTNHLDGTATDMLSVVFFKDQGFDVTMTSKTEGVFRIVANASDLDITNTTHPLSIGISSNTIIEYITDIFIDTYDLDVEKIAIPQMPTRLEMLNSGALDLATLPDPLASNALIANHSELATSESLGVNPAIMLFTNTALTEKENEVIAFYKAYNQAVDYINNTPIEDLEATIIELCDFPEETQGHLALPLYSYATLPESQEWEQVLSWMKSKGLTESHYSFSEVMTDQFISGK